MQVKVRSEARNVGLRAVRKAAAERAREALLASERHVVQVAISSSQPKLAAAVGCIANESAMASAPTATRAMARESNIDVLDGISMTPLHRREHKALHPVYTCRRMPVNSHELRCAGAYMFTRCAATSVSVPYI